MKTKFTFFGGLILLISLGSCEADEIETSDYELLNTADLKAQTTFNNGMINSYSNETVIRWSELISQSIDFRLPQPLEAKYYAMITLAMHDALNNVVPKYETYALDNSLVDAGEITKKNIHIIADAAVSQAARDVLVQLYPPAAAAAGSLLPLAVGLAAVVAYANAAASAQLATVHPVSGGTYTYGRRQLGEWPGFLAGWSFITGKLASCAAMALTFGLYAAPGFEKAAGVAAVVALTSVNLLGITRTALLTRIIVALVVPVLSFVIVVAFAQPADAPGAVPVGPTGVLQAAFSAFIGETRDSHDLRRAACGVRARPHARPCRVAAAHRTGLQLPPLPVPRPRPPDGAAAGGLARPARAGGLPRRVRDAGRPDGLRRADRVRTRDHVRHRAAGAARGPRGEPIARTR